MRLTPISEKITAELKKVENARKVDTTQKTRAFQADKSEFSSDAKRLSDTKANADIAQAQVAGEPEIREDKVAEVRARIESGYYDSPEFLDKLTEKLIKDLGLTG